MTIDERIAAELRRHVPEVDEHGAWDRIRSSAPAHRRSRALTLVATSAAAFGFVLLAFMLVPNLASGPQPASDPQSPYLDTWVTTDLDGSTPIMVIQVEEGETLGIVVHDDFASVCSGAASTMTGSGRLGGSTELLIPAVLTCDDGSEPEALSGPPLDEQLQNLTFTHDPGSDTLTDNFGSVWERVTADTTPETISGMWPQASLEEVQEAQRLADSGDPRYAWQLAPGLEESLMTSPAHLDIPDIFDRFLREELGWEEFSRLPGPGFGDGTIMLTFVRCAPGQTNSIYPDDPRGGRCAPTIDEVHYETVEITVAQPVRRDSSGIWVVTQWENLEPIEQVIPPTDAEANAIMEAFLEARIEGEGAEQYFGGGGGTAPLLYATSTGAPYERYEYGLVSGPEWPGDSMRFEVQLFAEKGQTVVESSFTVERDAAGRLGLEIGSENFENGHSLPQPHEFLDGEVTFYAAPPWDPSFAGWEFSPTMTTLHLDGNLDQRLVVLADPRPIETGCVKGVAPGDADALAQDLRSDPDLEASEPVPVHLAGIEGLQMDVVAATSGNLCDEVGVPEVVAGGTATGLQRGQRMRLYLIDYPGASAQILSIAIVAPESSFERVVEAATPILDSIELHTG